MTPKQFLAIARRCLRAESFAQFKALLRDYRKKAKASSDKRGGSRNTELLFAKMIDLFTEVTSSDRNDLLYGFGLFVPKRSRGRWSVLSTRYKV